MISTTRAITIIATDTATARHARASMFCAKSESPAQRLSFGVGSARSPSVIAPAVARPQGRVKPAASRVLRLAAEDGAHVEQARRLGGAAGLRRLCRRDFHVVHARLEAPDQVFLNAAA